MVKKSTKTGLDAGGWLSNYIAKQKADAEIPVHGMDAQIAIPLAHFIMLGVVPDDVPAEERALFNKTKKLATESWEELLGLPELVEDERLRSKVTAIVERLCAGVSGMSHFMPPASIIERGMVKGQQLKQAKKASNAKAKKNKPKLIRLYTAIQEEAEALNINLSKGLKFAQRVRPGVRKRLGLNVDGKDWPSPSTIKNCIANPPERDEQDKT